MLGIVHPVAYLLGVIAIVLVPGPNSIYVLTSAARHGCKVGYGGALGIFLGDSTLMMLTAMGAASVLHANLMLFNIVRMIGAAYLFWLGGRMLLGGWRTLMNRQATAQPTVAETLQPDDQPAMTFFACTRKALMISLINPKAILFFLSFFVQFVDPGYAYPAASFVVLGAIMQCVSMAYLSVLIVAGARLARMFAQSRKLKALMHSLVGMLFVGFGARLAV